MSLRPTQLLRAARVAPSPMRAAAVRSLSSASKSALALQQANRRASLLAVGGSNAVAGSVRNASSDSGNGEIQVSNLTYSPRKMNDWGVRV